MMHYKLFDKPKTSLWRIPRIISLRNHSSSDFSFTIFKRWQSMLRYFSRYTQWMAKAYEQYSVANNNARRGSNLFEIRSHIFRVHMYTYLWCDSLCVWLHSVTASFSSILNNRQSDNCMWGGSGSLSEDGRGSRTRHTRNPFCHPQTISLPAFQNDLTLES